MMRAIRTLSAVVGLAANLIPLYGVLYWQRDTFQLPMLYWIETVIIAFWTIRRIARLPIQELGTMTVNGQVKAATRAMLCGFFTLHAGAFIPSGVDLTFATHLAATLADMAASIRGSSAFEGMTLSSGDTSVTS